MDGQTIGSLGAIAAIAVALIGAVGSVAAAWIAKRAERNTRPVSNGFATDVRESLRRIEGRVGTIESGLIEHLGAHADAQLHVSVKPPGNNEAAPVQLTVRPVIPTAEPPASPDTWDGDDA